MAISKRTRFEVFKRDAFTCKYCGRKPPEVVLNADHMLARSKGGPDTMENLVTACFDCNSGKSDVSLSAIPKALEELAKTRREKARQMRWMRALFIRERSEQNKALAIISNVWVHAIGEDYTKFTITKDTANSIRKFLPLLPLKSLTHAAGLLWRVADGDADDQLRYFCGICWKMVREREVA